jgi:hypothetical protein
VIKALDPFSLPETVKVVCLRDGVFGQGFFEPHQADYECGSGDRKPAKPEINISSNRTTGLFEIHSITIYTLKIVNNPAKVSLPRAGENVTNDKNLRIRTPPDEPEGKGYWRSVIREMERYENQGVNLQWYAPGSTAYHEELHNQQFREGIRKNRQSLIRKIEEAINKTLANMYKPGIVEARNAAQDAVQENTRSVLVVTGNDSEPEAYRKTFAALWRPEIDKIGKYAQEHGWN